MNKLITFIFVAGILTLVSVGYVFASATDGTIDTTFKYAWSENIGWINFGASGGNVHIADYSLTGYAWNNNYGWINLNPSGSGIKNNVQGTLSGSAWGESTGYINFSGVTINSNGEFIGTASGDITGTINFNCSNCKVKTDWRPASSRRTGPGFLGYLLGNAISIPPFLPPINPNAAGGITILSQEFAGFNKNFRLGDTDNDIKILQQYLNALDFPVASQGPGSPGNETNFFGPLTKQALIKFQEAHAKEILTPLGLTKGTGIFGPATRKYLNSLK